MATLRDGTMSPWRFITRSLTHHLRINVSVALGVAAATAVLVGALLVGDSVRESLRRLTLERLGEIDEVLVTDRFFRAELADELAASDSFKSYYDQVSPAILFPHATVEFTSETGTSRSSNVLIVGCDESFWDFGGDSRNSVRPQQASDDEQIVVNQALADDLNAATGSSITIRLPSGNQVPADSPLADKSDRIQSIPNLEVVDVIPARGLGRFSLRPSQGVPLVAFVSIATLQDVLDQTGKVNSLLVSLKDEIPPNNEAASDALAKALRPAFEDYGLSITRITQSFNDDVIFDYFTVSTDRMIISPKAEAAAKAAFEPMGGQGVMTYLANTIQRDGERASEGEGEKDNGPISYSMVSGIDDTAAFRLLDVDGSPIGPLADNEVILNSWSAEDQSLKVGDKVRMVYFEPETTHGKAEETSAVLTVKAITPLTMPAQPFKVRGRRITPAMYDLARTLANDPDLTPVVEGVTDAETIENWNAPFPVNNDLVRSQDNDYWDFHRTTPKVFVSLATAERLWGSRFGRITSFRIPAADGVTEESLKQAFMDELASSGESLGLAFIPVKRNQLSASKGTTPFDGLFLGLSFFIIAAALLLVFLLFRLGVEQRAAEVGTLLAVGLRRKQVSRMLVAEGGLVAMVGGIVGVIVGIGYAWLMLAGLRTWWVGAITTPFLNFHWTAKSLAIGYVSGVLVSVLTIWWSVRRMKNISVRRLLAGDATAADAVVYKPQRRLAIVAVVLIVVAIGLAVVAVCLGGMAQAGAFLGAGALMLTGLLIVVWTRLKSGGGRGDDTFTGGWALTKLALRNAARNPGRSVTTIGLMATASFLIVGLSSFRLAPSNAGAGGFNLLAQSSEPIFENLNTQAAREELLAEKASVLNGGSFFAFRFKPGDDASCNNLYRSSQPRVIGVGSPFVDHFDRDDVQQFRWMKTEASSPEEKQNPWRLLDGRSRSRETSVGDDADNGPNSHESGYQGDAHIPVIIDMNTATYSLKLPGHTLPITVGSEFTLTYDEKNEVSFRVVGLLENSVLQGSLLIDEEKFEDKFDEVSGYRYFLIQTAAGKQQEVTELLEDRLGDQGFDVVETSTMLEQLFSVQNTYLSTFQSLGALGLLLGTFGLAAVQMRNVLERRGELALLRATGFKRQRLARMVMLENILLLIGGLATGTIAALLAVLPHKFTGEASIPTELLRDLGLMLLAVLIVGLLSSILSVRASLRMPVLAALRGE